MLIANFMTTAAPIKTHYVSERKVSAYEEGLKMPSARVRIEATCDLPDNVLDDMRAFINAHK